MPKTIQKNIGNKIGGFMFSKSEHFLDRSEYHFDVNNYYVLAGLLSRCLEGDIVNYNGYNESPLFEIYQFNDTCIQLLKNNSETLLSIFNREFDKRKQTLKLLDEVFV